MTATPHLDDDARRERLVRRHHLDRSATAIDELAGEVVGLHASDPATVFLSLRARIPGFLPADLEAALYDERTVAKVLGMRRTMFVVPPDVAAVIDAACAKPLAAAERRRLVRLVAEEGLADDPEPWLDGLADRVLDHLSTHGEATAVELTKVVPELGLKIVMAKGKRYEANVGVSTRLLFLLAGEGRVVRGRPLGGWLSSQYRWAETERWLGRPLDPWEPAEARVEVARRWLATYGPGTVEDLRWWSGWPLGQTRAALAEVGATAVTLDGGAEGWVLADDVHHEPDADTAAVVALLPSLDPAIMGWKERGWYLGAHREHLFDRNGNGGPAIWVGGRIVGGWAQRKDGEVVHELLDDVGAAVAATIEVERAGLQDWFGDVRFTSRFPTPLEQRLRA